MVELNRDKDLDFSLTDAQAIEAIQSHNETMVRRFYISCKTYFEKNHKRVLFFSGRAQEAIDLFHETFVTLWREIEEGQIFNADGQVCKFDSAGRPHRMRASLTTYMMGIAKNKNLEIARDDDMYISEICSLPELAEDLDEDYPVVRIVRKCVDALPKRCLQILTLFYCDGKTLDQILEIRQENISKNGLKTSKSKCVKTLRKKINLELISQNLKPYSNA